MNLFGESEKPIVRTLGWWQPFGSLMLHGKIETRMVRDGRKPPFPLGLYLIYTTKKAYREHELLLLCGHEIHNSICFKLEDEPTKELFGYAIGVGTLAAVRPMEKQDEPTCFVPYHKDRHCLVFSDVSRIEPFEFHHGKQGIGFLSDDDYQRVFHTKNLKK